MALTLGIDPLLLFLKLKMEFLRLRVMVREDAMRLRATGRCEESQRTLEEGFVNVILPLAAVIATG